MSCICENKKAMCEYSHVRELARKAAILEQCIYAVYKKTDGTYGFDKADSEINIDIVEYVHFL